MYCGPDGCSMGKSGSYRDIEKGRHTSSTDISERISMTSRAACRLDASSVPGIVHVLELVRIVFTCICGTTALATGKLRES